MIEEIVVFSFLGIDFKDWNRYSTHSICKNSYANDRHKMCRVYIMAVIRWDPSILRSHKFA